MRPKIRPEDIGKRFGSLVIESFASPGGRLVNVLCDCGTRKVMKSRSIVSGRDKSCGCQAGNRTHGHSSRKTYGRSSSEYAIWQGIKRRCQNPKELSYPRYGGRGITICERWRTSFGAFFADVGPRPSTQHSLDRWPNNDGNYEPGNVRWATRSEQMRNTRQNHLVPLRGKNITLIECADLADLSFCGMRYRLENGMSPEAAIALPKMDGPRRDGLGRFKPSLPMS